MDMRLLYPYLSHFLPASLSFVLCNFNGLEDDGAAKKADFGRIVDCAVRKLEYFQQSRRSQPFIGTIGKSRDTWDA
jgi:hypothetical protein